MFTIEKGKPITTDVLLQAVKWNELNLQRFQQLQDYYRGQHKILTREKSNGLKNNKVVVNHAKYITKINVGYLLGNPVDYKPVKDANIDLKPVIEQFSKQKISNIDTEIGTIVSKFGIAGEYIYTVGNDVHSRAVDPRNYVVIYDDTMEHEMLAVIIYSRIYNSADNETKYLNAMVIDAKEIYYYDEKLEIIKRKEEHFFKVIPFVNYRNNADDEGDYEQVIALIDAYNTLMSDRVNDKEQLVEALLVIYGFKLTPEQIKIIKEHGILGVPDVDGKAEYITKTLQEESIDVLQNSIEQDIHKISMTPNLSDENFAGNDSGVAIRYKLIAFELNTATKESYFELGLVQRVVIYNNYLITLKQGGGEIEAYQVDAIFKRKLPQNDFETSQAIGNLKGIVSDRTLISQLSFVDDVDAEIDQAKRDAEERAQALTDQFGTDMPSGGNNPQDNQTNKSNNAA